MKKLLHIEWLKVRKYKTFWLLNGLFALLFLSWSYGVKQQFISTSNLLASSMTFPAVWGNLAYIYSWFAIFLCVYIIISISNEYTYKTNRQHVIDGMDRLEFLHAKGLLILCFSLAATLLYMVTALLFGFLSGDTNAVDQSEKTLYVFLFTLNYLSFSAVLAFMVKRSGLSIILLLAYFLVESILSGLINWKFDTFAGNLLPLQCSDELLPLQSLKTLQKLAGKSKPEAPAWSLVSFTVGYIGLYYFLMRRKLLRSDW